MRSPIRKRHSGQLELELDVAPPPATEGYISCWPSIIPSSFNGCAASSSQEQITKRRQYQYVVWT